MLSVISAIYCTIFNSEMYLFCTVIGNYFIFWKNILNVGSMIQSVIHLLAAVPGQLGDEVQNEYSTVNTKVKHKTLSLLPEE